MVAPPFIGIVRNPKSRRNRDRPGVHAAALGHNVLLREPRTHEELAAVCAEFARAGIALLAIDGGDGTVRDTLSAAVDAFEALPPLAFLASGKTNILAAGSGSWGTGAEALRRLAATPDLLARPRNRLATVSIETSERRLLGFVFGAGAYARAIALADQGVADRIDFGPARIAAGIGRAVAALSRGAERERWLAGVPMRVSLDGEGGDVEAPARFILMATTLPRFTLGVWPFWNADERPLRWLDVEAPPSRFAAALLPVLSGRPKPWMREAGYRSGSATSLVVDLDEPFVLDGEAFAPGPADRITVTAGPVVEFVSP